MAMRMGQSPHENIIHSRISQKAERVYSREREQSRDIISKKRGTVLFLPCIYGLKELDEPAYVRLLVIIHAHMAAVWAEEIAPVLHLL